MNLSICKSFQFDAAHSLPNYVGKCHNLHGHRFTLEVEISGEPRKDTGMIMDFGDLKCLVNEVVIDKMDHHYLNDLFFNPTAEVMVLRIVEDLQIALIPFTDITLERIRLYETPSGYCEWKRG